VHFCCLFFKKYKSATQQVMLSVQLSGSKKYPFSFQNIRNVSLPLPPLKKDVTNWML